MSLRYLSFLPIATAFLAVIHRSEELPQLAIFWESGYGFTGLKGQVLIEFWYFHGVPISLDSVQDSEKYVPSKEDILDLKFGLIVYSAF